MQKKEVLDIIYKVRYTVFWSLYTYGKVVIIVEVQTKKKRIILTIILVSIIAIISAVLIAVIMINHESDSSGSAELSANEVLNKVIDKMNYQNLSPISSQNISNYYELPPDTISDCSMYISSKSESGIELTCFILADDSCEEKVRSTINHYLSTKDATYKELTDKPLKYKTTVELPYIFVAISDDCDNASVSFRNVITGKL